MGLETVDETVCAETMLVVGMLSRRSVVCVLRAREPRGEGERERRERGEANPLVRPVPSMDSSVEEAGATTAICSMPFRSAIGEVASPGGASMSSVARMAAALSSTDGTACSNCSVLRERGMRCGFVVAGDVGLWSEVEDGESMGSMSRSKMADDDE